MTKRLIQNILKGESSSCRCSMILIGREEETQNNVFQILNTSRTTRRNPRTFLGPGSEKKWKGKSNYPPEGKLQDTANMMVEPFGESGHPVNKGVSPLARGILRKKSNKETVHFNAVAWNTELQYRTNHSANQLSIYGAVERWWPGDRAPKARHQQAAADP